MIPEDSWQEHEDKLDRAQARREEREDRSCHCFGSLEGIPGHCPGPTACPYSDCFETDE